jgi:hypothetical protein
LDGRHAHGGSIRQSLPHFKLRVPDINHERLTYFYQGRRFRLTDVHGKVVQDLIA